MVSATAQAFELDSSVLHFHVTNVIDRVHEKRENGKMFVVGMGCVQMR